MDYINNNKSMIMSNLVMNNAKTKLSDMVMNKKDIIIYFNKCSKLQFQDFKCNGSP